MQTSNPLPAMVERTAKSMPKVTAFICSNCARRASEPRSTNRPVPRPPDFRWPVPVHEILVPCSGRLQPEHLLKAFETGADAVCVFGCQEDDCHNHEGSRRCARRVEYVRGLLDEIGIGNDRLWLFRLPGSAREDMALGLGGELDPVACERQEEERSVRVEQELRIVRQELADKIAGLRQSPIHNSQWSNVVVTPVLDDDQSED